MSRDLAFRTHKRVAVVIHIEELPGQAQARRKMRLSEDPLINHRVAYKVSGRFLFPAAGKVRRPATAAGHNKERVFNCIFCG